MERQHTYKLIPEGDAGWRYAVLRDGVTVEKSQPIKVKELAIARGHERACELDGILD